MGPSRSATVEVCVAPLAAELALVALADREVGADVEPCKAGPDVGDAQIDGAISIRMVGEPGPPRWSVRQLRLLPGCGGAVAAEGRDWAVELRSTR